MKIEWNKVTKLSKIFALALFIILPLAGFFAGVKYGKLLGIIENGKEVWKREEMILQLLEQ